VDEVTCSIYIYVSVDVVPMMTIAFIITLGEIM